MFIEFLIGAIIYHIYIYIYSAVPHKNNWLFPVLTKVAGAGGIEPLAETLTMLIYRATQRNVQEAPLILVLSYIASATTTPQDSCNKRRTHIEEHNVIRATGVVNTPDYKLQKDLAHWRNAFTIADAQAQQACSRWLNWLSAAASVPLAHTLRAYSRLDYGNRCAQGAAG